MPKRTVDLIPDTVIAGKILRLRGHNIMLDRDLAVLFGVRAIRLREQVKRNSSRFPDHFMFQLSEEEVEEMVSQNAIPSRQVLGGALPYAFTEHGVLMLANVLKSESAVQASIKIIEVFIRLRELLLMHKDVLLKLEQLERQVVQQSEEIKVIFDALRQLIEQPAPARPRIGFRTGTDAADTA